MYVQNMSKAKGADWYTEGPLRRRCLPSVKTGSLTKRPTHTVRTHVRTYSAYLLSIHIYSMYERTYVLSMHMKVHMYVLYVLSMYMNVCTYGGLSIHMNVCMYVCMHACTVHTYVRTCTYMYVHTVHIRTYVCQHSYICPLK